MKRKILIIAGVAVLAVLLVHLRYLSNLRPFNPHDEVGAIVEIPSGSTSTGIGKILEQKKIIRSASAFATFAKRSGHAGELKAGSFFLKPSMSVEEVVNTLVKGFNDQIIVTIPEGTTVQDLDDLLAEKGIARPGDIVACAKTCDFSSFTFLPKIAPSGSRGGAIEGYLFPDTYFVIRGDFTPQSFLARLLKTFQSRVVEGLASDMTTSGRKLHDVVTMASLIEEETRTDAERPVVSGILWKRLEKGMRLDVDAAVRYFLGKKSEPLTTGDLESENPYNLRKVRGLPPGPIANAGLSSIKAALHPEKSDYFYYLHGDNGKIRYAVTNDEHNANRAKYLR